MKMNDLDELHHFVNDLYERWDEGEISYLQARADARFYCHKFVFKTLREEHLKFAEGKYKITLECVSAMRKVYLYLIGQKKEEVSNDE